MSVDDKPMVVVRFDLADGQGVIERTWRWSDLKDERSGGVPAFLSDGPPGWLDRPRKRWDHPQEPITYTGRVRPGHEEEARKVVESA